MFRYSTSPLVTVAFLSDAMEIFLVIGRKVGDAVACAALLCGVVDCSICAEIVAQIQSPTPTISFHNPTPCLEA